MARPSVVVPHPEAPTMWIRGGGVEATRPSVPPPLTASARHERADRGHVGLCLQPGDRLDDRLGARRGKYRAREPAELLARLVPRERIPRRALVRLGLHDVLRSGAVDQ